MIPGLIHPANPVDVILWGSGVLGVGLAVAFAIRKRNVSLADARAALELISALYHSTETGQAVEYPLQKPSQICWMATAKKSEVGSKK